MNKIYYVLSRIPSFYVRINIMASQTVGVKPTILKWARESLGYSIGEVAERLNRDPEEVRGWEAGEGAPTYAQLERLAYELYKRPLAIFFFPEPPIEPEPQREFRTLPATDLDSLHPDTRYQIRIALSLQESLRELNGNRNPSDKCIFRDIKLSFQNDVAEQAAQVRNYLQVDMGMQIAWRDEDEALKSWRSAIEEVGLFVFKNTFKQKSISGFCLLDDEFPIIYLNNSTAKNRQIFSLMHELAHVLLQVSGISKFDSDYIDKLGKKEQQIEKFCNLFAAEILIPIDDFREQIEHISEVTDSAVQKIAKRYCVSRESVLRRFLDLSLVTLAYYLRKSSEWNAQYDSGKSPPGGDYYATQASYLGEKYLRSVFEKYYQGRLNLNQVSEYLGVKVKSIPGLEAIISRKGILA
jgi:Zn-dependent peptidase ImmA (M78 family)